MIREIEMAQKLHKCRDTVKRFWKEEFPEKIKPYSDIVKAVMNAKHIEAIPALLEISKTETYQEEGMAQLMFMAATVELIESENK
ncbi:MAG: hypothetical protein B7Y83_00130 [Flavobacteriales bacterium 32-34-25]|nr:MAG: hypothetical protein B7Y83_00130 [Flavobacteriales bacterium 32-34-25]